MAKRKKQSDFEKRVRNFGNSVDDVEKEIDKNIIYAEKWVIARRKFFIKLGWTTIFILALLIVSELFMTVKVSS